METRMGHVGRDVWEVPFSVRLVQESRNSLGVHGTYNPQKLKTAFPELAELLDQPAGKCLEIFDVDYDNVHSKDPKVIPVPYLVQHLGYFVQVQAYYKDPELVDLGVELEADLDQLELDSQRGANLIYQVAGFYRATAYPPISRKGNPNRYFEEKDRLKETRDITVRQEETYKILIPQVLTVTESGTDRILYHNQTLEEQLKEFEIRMNQR